MGSAQRALDKRLAEEKRHIAERERARSRMYKTNFIGTRLIGVDPEFSALVPSLDPKELAELEASIRRDGIRDPLKVWGNDGNGILVLDGHNRLKLAEVLGIEDVPYQWVPVPDREHALLWIEENQVARRNLTDDQRAVIWVNILERRAKVSRSEAAKTREAGKRGEAPQAGETPARGEKLVHPPKKDVRAEVAKEARIPENKLRIARQVAKHPELAKEVRTGKKTLAVAKKEVEPKPKESVQPVPDSVGSAEWLKVERRLRGNEQVSHPSFSNNRISVSLVRLTFG